MRDEEYDVDKLLAAGFKNALQRGNLSRKPQLNNSSSI